MTDTPEPTLTDTPTATPTATLSYYVEMTTPAGSSARVVREVSVGDYLVILLLFAILVSLWSFYIVNRLRGGDK